MERRDFLQSGCRCGVAAAGMALLAPTSPAVGATTTVCPQQQQPNLATQMHAWLVDLMAAVDSQLGPQARVRLLQACGRAEVRRTALAGAPRPTMTLEQLAARWRRAYGEANVRLEGNRLELIQTVCDCPLVGPTPERLSDTWCECAVGGMTELVAARLGRPVRTELREAIKRGSQRCHWIFQV